MFLHVVADQDDRIARLRMQLGQQCRITSSLRHEENSVPKQCDAAIVNVDLKSTYAEGIIGEVQTRPAKDLHHRPACAAVRGASLCAWRNACAVQSGDGAGAARGIDRCPPANRIHRRCQPGDQQWCTRRGLCRRRLACADRDARQAGSPAGQGVPGSRAESLKRAALHSISPSARASRFGGRSMPSAFAVLRFTTSSNLVGCSTGRSPGLAPRKILSTYSAARRNKSR
jgi:hypothetical protein